MRFIVRLLIEAAPRLAVALVLLTLLQAALPVLNVRLTQLIVNALASRHAFSSILPPLLIYVALHLAAAGLTPTLNVLQALVNERLVEQVTLRVLAKVNSFTDLSRFEDPALYDDLKTIGERAPGLPRRLLQSITEVVQAVLATAGLSLLLASLHPLVPLLLLAATLPALTVHRQNARLLWGQHQETVALERRQEYWLEVGTSGGSNARRRTGAATR